LHDTKENQLKLLRKATDLRGDLEIHRDAHALDKPINEIAQRQVQTGLVHQRRMQQIGHGPDLANCLLKEVVELSHCRSLTLW
jgi:hypothetical protein